MNIFHLAVKEILHRKLNFALGLLSIIAAIGVFVGALTLLKIHDLRTHQILEAKEAETRVRMAALEDEMRKAMLNLGFNIVILPKDVNLTDWHADDYAAKYMPEDYIEKLAKCHLITVQHLLPSLQQKIKWPEQKRTVLLVGTRGEVPHLGAGPKKPMVEPVPQGAIVLGFEIHQDLGLKVGDKVTLMGREFTVHKCHDRRGNKDDITVWIHLSEAQELLDKKGLINAILALECQCAWANLPKVREEITKILPDTQVIERASEALARAEARIKVGEEAVRSVEQERQNRLRLRAEREQFAAVLVPTVMIASALWIGFLAFGNVRERRVEIGTLRALGLRSRQVLLLFLSKAVVMGLVGGAIGYGIGYYGGELVGRSLEHLGTSESVPPGLFDWKTLALAMGLAPLLSAVASWIPAVLAVQQDPAEVLREE